VFEYGLLWAFDEHGRVIRFGALRED
jgi:hypothetical protein